MNIPTPCPWCGRSGCRGACEAPVTYLATIGVDLLHEAGSLDTLLAYVRGVHEAGRGESIALWRAPGTLVAVIQPDGSLLRLDAATSEGRATR